MSRTPPIVGVFTGTRAEYGLLRPVLAALEASEQLTSRLIVGGAHLSKRHGATLAEIEADGRTIDARVPAPMTSDDGVAIAQDMAATLAGCARAYRDLALDAVLMLGDRTEVLAAAAAAVPLALPVLHLEGGHRTQGAIDDAIRHAVSKLAALHFTAAEPYRQRLLQMGEAPERVFTVGSTGVDNLRAFGAHTIDQAAAVTGLDLQPGLVLATFHPETLSPLSPEAQAIAFLKGLEAVGERMIVLTQPNADAGSDTVRRALDRFAQTRPYPVLSVGSLGARGYAAALSACDLVIGNSSSGVIEAPAAGVPSVNIGERQAGRLRASSVLDAALEPAAIAAAIREGLDPDFRERARHQPPIFGDGRAGARIVRVLEAVDFARLAQKPFVDRI